MKNIFENIVKCLSEGRLSDAYKVMEGFLAADGLEVYRREDLYALVQIFGCLKSTPDSK